MSQTANPVDLGDRVAWWLRSSGMSAKQVARVVDASEGTAKRLRAGIPPTTGQMTLLAKHFGWRFVQFCFEAVLGPDDAQLAADLDDIKGRLARLEQSDELDRPENAGGASAAGPLAHGPCRVVAAAPRSKSGGGC